MDEHLHSTWQATLRTILAAATVVTLVLLAFAWPSYTAKPKGMPVAIVAPTPQRAAVAQQLEAAGGAFTVVDQSDRAAAVEAIEQRGVYGALVFSGQKTEVLTASAGSAAATQMLAGAAQKLGAQQMAAVAAQKQQAAGEVAKLGAQAAAAAASAQTLATVSQGLPAAQAAAMKPQVEAAQKAAAGAAAKAKQAQDSLAATSAPVVAITDVVPLASSDARGTGIAIAGLPLTMGGMIGGVLISMLLVGWKRRLVAVAGYGVLGGLLLTGILQGWFGFIQGGFWMNWLVIGASIAATAAFIVGAHSLLGRPGLALGAILTLFVGNPLSSQSMPKEWLPGAWGEIGQWFVPGAAGNLMRIESYFPQASTFQPWLALLVWFGLGVVLAVVGRRAGTVAGAVVGSRGDVDER
ncbi:MULTISPECIES: hypothetical protein [unclassified Luteococcus]|uniref:hypothetical protein n=1 Tax=unclassified Luteococcus TaxID=2639923 RepID=UPI00313CD2D1